MSRPLRTPSERYAVCCSVPDSGSFCSQDGRHFSASSEDDPPIFSTSKSSVDVLASSPHQRDTTFGRPDVRRSPSASEQNCQLGTFQNPNMPSDSHGRPAQALSERWVCGGVQRWSSCSAQSRSSTPDTVIFKGSPCPSVTQEKPPGSSQLGSPAPRTPSPELTPTNPSQNANEQTVSSENHQDLSPNPNSPPFSPLQAKKISPLPPKELLCFTFPSPVSSSVSLEKFAAEDPLYAVRNSQMDVNLYELATDTIPQSFELQFKKKDFVLHDFTPTRRPPLVTSLSDPYIGVCCRCNEHFCKNKVDFRNLGIHEEGTMTSNAELVDIAVQTFSPVGSWWNLKRNVSNVGSQSLLGSPPGSRLNLRCPVGSHSNLVSPSSSMFVVNSDEEESKIEKESLSWETSSNVESERRSCLKIHNENKELGRRSSMKQVQWDEDGMTWDVHGAAIDPEELNMAIQKHLELKCNDEEEKDAKPPKRKSSKKKRAPRPPVNLKPPVILIEGRRKDERRDSWEGEIGRTEEGEEEEARRGSQSPRVVQRKRSVIRTFKTSGWCGGSGKHKD